MEGDKIQIKKIYVAISEIVSLIFLCLLSLNYDGMFWKKIDTVILQFMMEHTSDGVTMLMNVITFFGTIGGVTLILLLMILVSRFQKRVLLYSALILSTYLINGVIKNIVMRPRPAATPLTFADGYSFVSGHSSTSIVMSVILIAKFVPNIKNQVLRNCWIVILSVLPFCIAFSRLYLRVHYFTDVLGGWLVAVIYLNIQCFMSIEKRGKKNDRTIT